METKTIDSLLNELNDVQLSKKNMSCIYGGSVWDSSWAACSSTGYLIHYIDGDGISHLLLEGHAITPTEMVAQGDNKLLSLETCNPY